jgi:hypothetical protein
LTWLKIGDEFLEDETIGELHDRTFRVHVKGLVYCARNNTDGHLSVRAVKVLQALLGYSIVKNVDELVRCKLWVPVLAPVAISDGTVFDDGYSVKNFLKFNPTRLEVQEEREKSRARAKEGRAKAKAARDEKAAERSAVRSPERSAGRTGSPTRPDPKRSKGFSVGPAGGAGGQPWDFIQLREIA